MVKEKAERNQLFINRNEQLVREQGLSQRQADALIATEFNISNHSLRAWKSRLKLGYGAQFDKQGNLLSPGRYTNQITPFMGAPSPKKHTATVNVTPGVPCEIGQGD